MTSFKQYEPIPASGGTGPNFRNSYLFYFIIVNQRADAIRFVARTLRRNRESCGEITARLHLNYVIMHGNKVT